MVATRVAWVRTCPTSNCSYLRPGTSARTAGPVLGALVGQGGPEEGILIAKLGIWSQGRHESQNPVQGQQGRQGSQDCCQEDRQGRPQGRQGSQARPPEGRKSRQARLQACQASHEAGT